MEREKFEDKWRDALKGAEVSPSDNVWTNIELDLEKAETGGIRRKLIFYKSVAAASVIFALAWGASGLYMYNERLNSLELAYQELKQSVQENNQTKNLSTETTTTAQNLASVDEKNQSQKEAANERDGERNEQPNSEFNIQSEKKRNSAITAHTVSNQGIQNQKVTTEDKTSLAVTSGGVEREEDKNVVVGENLPQITYDPQPVYKPENGQEAKKEEVDPVKEMMAKLDKREEEIKNQSQKKNKKSKKSEGSEQLWTSVGFAAGSFDSRGSSISPTAKNQAFFNNQATRNASQQEADASGLAYSVGLNVGKRVAERWVLQGGVNYLTQSSSYTAQTAVSSNGYSSFAPESINAFDRMNTYKDAISSENTLINMPPYDVNNSMRYLSVPVQAGFLVLDSKLGLQLNAGVSTDLFLQNTKKVNGENIQNINQDVGDDNPFRTMNFSGLVGTELSYRFGSRYRVALNPGVRYPFSSIYKSDLGIKSAPVTIDVGLRFRYIFQ